MSSPVVARVRPQVRKLQTELQHQARSNRLVKILCGAVLGICFWYSVPYTLPYLVQHATAKAASAEAQRYEGSAARQLAMPVIAAVAAYLLWRLPARGKFGGPLNYLCTAYIGWAVVSITWSQDPSLTAKRLVVFLVDVLMAYALARTFSVLELALLATCVTGCVAALALYGDAVMQHIFNPADPDYRFQGVTDANYQAMSLVVGILSGLTLLDRRKDWKWSLLPLLLAALTLLYLTRSRLSTIICMLLVAVVGRRFIRRNLPPVKQAMTWMALLMILVPAGFYLVARNGEGGLQSVFMMGRTDTENTSNLSNRAPLWAELTGYVQERPLLGRGYAAFWSPERVYSVSLHQGWTVPHAHNSYLDQALALGIPGALMYVAMLWTAIAIGWKRYRNTGSSTDLWAAALMTWVALEGFAESVPLDPYLPSLLAYTCVIKMCLREGSEGMSDRWLRPHEIVTAIAPEAFARLAPARRQAYETTMEELLGA